MSLFGEISAKEHHGLRLAATLAETFYNQEPITLAEVGKRERISNKYLEHLIVPFRQAGWIKSQRGRHGGYVMQKNPKNITLKDVFEKLDGKRKQMECLKDDRSCLMEGTCSSKPVWGKIQKEIDKTLDNIKLSELVKK